MDGQHLTLENVNSEQRLFFFFFLLCVYLSPEPDMFKNVLGDLDAQ